MYPENPEETQVILGSMNMGYDIISDCVDSLFRWNGWKNEAMNNNNLTLSPYPILQNVIQTQKFEPCQQPMHHTQDTSV